MAHTQITAEPGSPDLTITTELDAPRDLVYRAHVDPELVAQWLGPHRLIMTIERCEVRDGGRWRFIHRDAEGSEFGFHGVFHGEPSLDEGILRTFEFEGAPGHVSLEKATFEERGGTTVLRAHAVYQSVEDRDAVLQSGMEDGVRESMDRLEELLAGLAQAQARSTM